MQKIKREAALLREISTLKAELKTKGASLAAFEENAKFQANLIIRLQGDKKELEAKLQKLEAKSVSSSNKRSTKRVERDSEGDIELED